MYINFKINKKEIFVFDVRDRRSKISSKEASIALEWKTEIKQNSGKVSVFDAEFTFM